MTLTYIYTLKKIFFIFSFPIISIIISYFNIHLNIIFLIIISGISLLMSFQISSYIRASSISIFSLPLMVSMSTFTYSVLVKTPHPGFIFLISQILFVIFIYLILLLNKYFNKDIYGKYINVFRSWMILCILSSIIFSSIINSLYDKMNLFTIYFYAIFFGWFAKEITLKIIKGKYGPILLFLIYLFILLSIGSIYNILLPSFFHIFYSKEETLLILSGIWLSIPVLLSSRLISMII